MTEPTVLIVPGLRDHVDAHWQTLLALDLQARGRKVCLVPPMGRIDLDCDARVAAIEHAVQAIAGPLVLVAHSAGCVMVAHWAQQMTRPIRGALLATPPDFERPMPDGYPTLGELRDNGWLPVPREPLPFQSVVAASRDDPLGGFDRIEQLARNWGSRFVDLDKVGHLNPASGYGPWSRAEAFIDELSTHVTDAA
ncbi:MAG TPA: alpha/beta fold hydrolase [Burkholderiaceae bacterium]